MQADRAGNNLTAVEKQKLREAHGRERYGFFAVEASGQDVLQQATTLLRALHDAAAASAEKPGPSWSSIVRLSAAESKVNKSSEDLASRINILFQKYQEAAKTFHGDLGRFEDLQSAERFAAPAAAVHASARSSSAGGAAL
eukprot:TRINITY_DN8095_c0_g1_i1.p1 TRINITY_DN8095_c0_g1~~TRINITY_DN8095_c0_g1_i1.p1  ORF type:complete len:141 (+),score=55.12 TRINITY_DN8095_c0_g1_i1:401-823(+)